MEFRVLFRMRWVRTVAQIGEQVSFQGSFQDRFILKLVHRRRSRWPGGYLGEDRGVSRKRYTFLLEGPTPISWD